MHIRANQLDIFTAAVQFDAAGTMAGAVFDHIERIGADLPGVCVVLRRVMGKAYRKWVGNHVRWDGKYRCFDMPDGSIVAVDFAQSPGSWLVAVESRTAWELLQGRDFQNVGHSLWAVEAPDERSVAVF